MHVMDCNPLRLIPASLILPRLNGCARGDLLVDNRVQRRAAPRLAGRPDAHRVCRQLRQELYFQSVRWTGKLTVPITKAKAKTHKVYHLGDLLICVRFRSSVATAASLMAAVSSPSLAGGLWQNGTDDLPLISRTPVKHKPCAVQIPWAPGN